MRSSFGFALVLLLAACGGTGTGTGDDDPGTDGGVEPPKRGFQVVSKDIDIMPGQEITYCYYFRTPNTEPMAVHTWNSVMTPGSHHMIMFTTTNDVMPPGTVSSSNCGLAGSGSATNLPVWTYAAQTPESTVALPTDDGAGKPLAQLIQPNTPAFFQMHYLNATDQILTVHVTLNAEALEAAVPYTETAAYVTYNANLSIPPTPPGGQPTVASKTCSVPASKKFWMMSTHAHKQAVKTEVKSGMQSGELIFSSTDWEHPEAKTWMATPFFAFENSAAMNKLTFECSYVNPTNRTITSGDSAQTDEMCMATGYMFPASEPTFCFCTGGGCFNI